MAAINISNTTSFTNLKIAYALTGSYCTFADSLAQMRLLANAGAIILPVMSANAFSTDTRFGSAASFREQIETICSNKIIHTIVDAEPIGPQKMADVMLVAPWWAGIW
ncbi:MAG: hypothetical protein FWD35_06545 [Oscillospiraceae bacterium]|nr:hypothetical protein [Oscillospiraceae bacterium]